MKSLLLTVLTILVSNCSTSGDGTEPPPAPTPPPVVTNEVDFWLTKGDQTVLLKKQSSVLAFGTKYNVYPNIEVDETKTFQTVDGFGYTLTGGSVQVIPIRHINKSNWYDLF